MMGKVERETNQTTYYRYNYLKRWRRVNWECSSPDR